MAVKIYVTNEGPTMAGEKIIHGKLNLQTYETNGDPVNLSNFFKSSTSPFVCLTGGTGGYVLDHNQGTAAAGKVLAYYTSTKNGAAGALDEVANATDLSAVNVSFFAIGQPY